LKILFTWNYYYYDDDDDDPYLRILAGKTNPLPEEYEPQDLEAPACKSYRTADTMMLRKKAERALEEMAAAARAEGIVLWEHQ
jgi:LAS superfamily LD-carboxypeptidase LdcB